jgi:hypothetical protein
MKFLLSLIVGISLYLPTLSYTQIIQHQISDDGYARVPLQFGFPYYGRVFTESYMFSNGVVGFLNPTNSWCCTGFDLRNNNGTPFNFAIMPLQTDLLNYSGKFLTEGTPQYQRYVWENISEYGVPQNLNTFGVEIRPSGYIGMHYEQVNISPWRPVTIGRTGDVGEYTQYYHGAGFSTNTPFSHITDTTGNLCVTNPLSSPSCARYQEAYLAQQCSISQLYSPQCPNYQQAYLEQQCSLNPLYSTSCQGYEQAYFNQQCSINALFNNQCQGYAQAYFDQQCSLNGLYDRQCPNYATAYATQQVTSPVTVSAPTLQVSTTGTVSVETPVVADPVVNEVITRQPTISSNVTNTQTTPVQSNNNQDKPEKKPESKPMAKVEAPKGEIPTQVIPQPVHEYKAPIILDMAYRSMVKKPIQDNNRSLYFLTMTSQIKHEEMVDGQYRK